MILALSDLRHSDASYRVSSKLAFFGHTGFPIGSILAIYDLQITPMLPTKFQANWPFGSGESWIFDRNDFCIFFFFYKSPRCFLPFRGNCPRGVGGEDF